MTYEEATDYILNIPKFSKKNKPAHTEQFLAYLGNPQDHIKVVHVAGTNGKGSVCAYLNAMLLSEKKTVGMFTSPHLIKINERIIINGCEVEDDAFARLFEEILKVVGQMREAGLPHPTFFEFLFGMAMTAFARAGVEYAVLETGLGGRLDATNVVKYPVATVITSIGMDHMEYLGSTLREIAAEKAGIIKSGVPVFFAEGQTESNQIIEKKAYEMKCMCKKIGKDAYEILGIKKKHIAFSCSNAYYGDTTWSLKNIGIYQTENAMLAMETMRFLFGAKGHPDRWRGALSVLCRAGRMEEILPDFYIDGAHNTSAVEAFAKSVSEAEKERIILFSAVQEKNYTEMIHILCKEVPADFYVVTAIENIRAVQPEILKEIFQKYTDKPVIMQKDIKQAVSYIREHRQGRTVYCLGSLYLAGRIKELMQEV